MVKLARVEIHGPVRLSGLAYFPVDRHPDIVCVVSHGFTASKDSVDLLASYIASRGYPAATFDFRGHKLGGSEGDFNHASDTLEDLTAASAFAMEQFQSPRCILIGHSMGAMVSLLVGAELKACVGVAAITTGMRPSSGFQQPVGQAMLSQRSDYISGAEPARILQEFDELVAEWPGMGTKPALFVGAKGDVVVKPSRVKELSERAGTNAEYTEIEGSHLEAPSRSRGVVANWLDAYF